MKIMSHYRMKIDHLMQNNSTMHLLLAQKNLTQVTLTCYVTTFFSHVIELFLYLVVIPLILILL